MPTISVDGTDVVITAKPGEAILAALARSGYAHRTGCRRGGCGICKIDLVDGTVEYPIVVADTVLSDDERQDGVCLSCRAVPSTDVVVRTREDDKLRCVAPLLAAIAAASARPESRAS